MEALWLVLGKASALEASSADHSTVPPTYLHSSPCSNMNLNVAFRADVGAQSRNFRSTRLKDLEFWVCVSYNSEALSQIDHRKLMLSTNYVPKHVHFQASSNPPPPHVKGVFSI